MNIIKIKTRSYLKGNSDMPSFDIVSKIYMQEVSNAIANSTKEITQRYDFKSSNSHIELKENFISVETEDEMKAKQVYEILISNFVKRKIDPKAIGLMSTENASGNRIRQSYELIEGIEQKHSKKIISEVKKSKLKVQVKIQGTELRVTGVKKDDLQKVMELSRSLKLDLPLQYVNFRD
jgi:hypothetical protein